MFLFPEGFVIDAVGCGPPPCYDTCPLCWSGCYCDYYLCEGQICCASGCCNPLQCQICVDGQCQYSCGMTQTCCGGECCDGTCCNGTCCKGSECEDCNSVTGACESRCKPENCEECNDVTHSCEVCGGDPNQVCCDGTCKPKCKLVDGDDCSGPIPTFCSGCSVPDVGCSWNSLTVIYEGGKEKKCNPEGCEGDCYEDIKLCYTEYICTSFEWPLPLAFCTGAYVDPGGGIGIGPLHCESTPVPSLCYICAENENYPIRHWVLNESCN